MAPNAIHLSELKVGVIINTSRGGYDLECEDKMLDILNGAGIVEAKIWCANADELERSFTESDLDLKDKSVAAFCLTRNAHHY